MPGLSRRTFLSATIALPAILGQSSSAFARQLAVPSLEFVSNPLADFLHLLLFRSRKERFVPFTHEGFADAPQLEHLVAVPEAVASAGLTRYEDILPYLRQQFAALPNTRIGGAQPKILSYSDDPPAFEAIEPVIASGASFYEPFHRYWIVEVEQQVSEQIATWRRQDMDHRPLEKLVAFHNISLRSDKLQVVAMPFHPAGSANYSPAGVYTSPFRTPDLGRVLGHEASHLLWSEAVGANWKAHPQAEDAVHRAGALGVDMEEAVCLLMQTELSRACGGTDASYRVSNDITDEGLKSYLAALEADWPDYGEGRGQWPTMIDYAIDKANTVFTIA